MNKKLLYPLPSFLVLALAIFLLFFDSPGKTLAYENAQLPAATQDTIPYTPALTTQSRFTQKTFTQTILLPFTKEVVDDPDSEMGTETVVQRGIDGQKTETVTVVYDQETGSEYSREVEILNTKEPIKEILARGTKVIIRELDTPQGKIRYQGKLRVWATSYDKTCPGCDEWTATGAHLEKGIIAVDPSIIPLHTKLYVPGYGLGRAEDVGGGIKGNKLDLGFEDLKNGNWSARWTEVFLLAD